MTDSSGEILTQSGTEVRLVIVDGADRGHEFVMDRDTVTIGRGADNDIVINDISSSRKHAKVVREGGVYRLVDLGSGNGTMMNGVAVKDETLQPGSLFKIGGTVFRFVRMGDVYSTGQSSAIAETGQGADLLTQPPMETVPINVARIQNKMEAGRTRSVLIYGLIALAIFLGAAVLVKYVVLPPDGEQSGQAVQPKTSAAKAGLQKLFEEGVEAYKRQDWVLAGERFKEVLAGDPQDERAGRYKAKVDEEKAGNEAIVKAKDMMAKGMHAAAVEILRKVPQDSYYSGQAAALISQSEGAMAAANRDQDEGKTDGVAGDGAQAAGSDRKVAVRGDQRSADGERPEKAHPKEKPDKGGKTDSGKDAVLDGFGAGEEPAKAEPVKASGPTAEKAIATFRKGDVAGAIELIETDLPGADAKADKLLSELKSFKAAMTEGEGYYKSKQDEGAVRALSRALQAAKSISPSGDNAYLLKLNAMLADMYFLRGMKAFYKDNYLVAVQNFQIALKFKPDHQQSQAKIGDVANAAGKIYEEAYVLKSADPEAAKKKFEMIIQITPATNEYNKKSKEWLKRL